MSLFQSQTITAEKDTDGSAFLKIDVPDRPVNMLTRKVMRDLDEALTHLAADKTLPALVIRSGKNSGFLAGGDLKEFLSLQTPREAEEVSAAGQAVFTKLAELPFPTLAVISGPCLGGGLELAMACDYRLVYDSPNTQLGLPEVQLGLLPGWGGTQRLPRIVGLERALQMILGNKRLSAREALRWGLADGFAVGEAGLRQQFAALLARAVTKGKVPRWGLPLATWRQRLLESHPMGRRVILRGAERMLRRRIPDDMPAPLEALEAVRTGIKRGIPAGLAQERAAAGRLATSTACRNLIHLFLAGEAARKMPADLASLQPRQVRRVGVVGAGVMGAGIAQLVAFKGFPVLVQEVNADALGAGMLRIKTLFDHAVERRLLTATEAERRLALVRGTVVWEGFDAVDLVVEAAVENLQAKQALFQTLEEKTSPSTVLATNTSSLRVALLQQGLRHPERVTALHFFNPVHKMPLVEVVHTEHTTAATLAIATQWAITLGKTPVQVKDSPGFLVNRILFPYLNEAILLVREGLSIREIDALMKRFGMPVGPLELLDEIGLDVADHVAESMLPLLDGRIPPNNSFELMKEKGWLGTKTGKGFYLHRGSSQKPNPLAENLLGSGQTPSPSQVLPKAARLSEARERMVLLMVNEAARVLSEGIVADAGTLDLAMILGTGWAPHRGGPLTYAASRGSGPVLHALEMMLLRHGERFQPAPQLKQLLQARESGLTFP